MRKVRLLLLIFPLIAGALYLRTLASWRPKMLLNGGGPVKYLTFSCDGATLLVTHERRTPQLVALDAAHNFATRWTYADKDEVWHPQFFLSDTRILLDGAFIRTLDAKRGQRLSKEGSLSHAAMSPDGTWLAYNNVNLMDGDAIVKSAQYPEQIILERFSPSSPLQKERKRLFISDTKRTSSTHFFSPDGQTCVVHTIAFEGIGRRSRLDFYDVKTWKRTRFWWTDTSSEELLVSGPTQMSRDGRFCYVLPKFFVPLPRPMQ